MIVLKPNPLTRASLTETGEFTGFTKESLREIV